MCGYKQNFQTLFWIFKILDMVRPKSSSLNINGGPGNIWVRNGTNGTFIKVNTCYDKRQIGK